MNIVLITQNEPFYLAENLEYLINNLQTHSNITGCVVLSPSPFGKKLSFFQKANRTRNIFGNIFFIRYTIKYLNRYANPKKSIKRILEKHKIPIISLKRAINHKESIELISKFSPDLLISILGNEIFKKPIIELASKGCLNLHSALLPKYRGLMPTFWVLRFDEKETGVSVFFVNEGIDSGPILVQKRLSITNQSQADLIIETKKLGMDAILEAIEKVHFGNYKLLPNEDSISSYYSLPTKEDVKEFIRNGKRFF